MNKKEVAEILAILSSYYTEKRNADPKRMVDDWHKILNAYDFNEMERAVIDFAKNDCRDYPTFPVPAQIINGLETIEIRERRTRTGVANALLMGKGYEGMRPEEKRYISKANYKRIDATWDYYKMATNREALDELILKLHREEMA